ncbi:MAG: DNA mismatch repair protein MutS [Alphaproteobacteria bacterium]|nr:DNA mismatch repair protein MutS [Alphaproteobacteria bacterium]
MNIKSKKIEIKKEKVAAVTPMMAQYLEVKKEYPDSLLFYRMGDFYELFFDDAVKASEALGITLTTRGKHLGEDIPMCGVPWHSHEGYLAKAIRRGFKVAVAEQTEDPAEAKKRGAKSVVKREVKRLVTAGTLTEDNLLDARSNNYLAAISDVRGDSALAWVDVSTGVFEVQNLGKIEVQSLSSSLSMLSPKELIIPDKMMQNVELYDLFKEWQQILSPMPTARFSSDNAEKLLNDFYGVKALDAFGSYSRAEISAAGVLVDYINITQKGSMPRLEPPRQVMAAEIMAIDSSTRSSLEITEAIRPYDANGSGGKRKGSLLSVVDKTVTGAGARLLSQYISAPLTNVDKISSRLDIVDFFFTHHSVKDSVRFCLKLCPDIERSLSRLTLGRGGARDLSAICQTLSEIPSLRNEISFASGDLEQVPEGLSSCLDAMGQHENLVSKLKRALKEELPVLIRDGGFIAEGHNPALDELRVLSSESKKHIAALQSDYAADTGVSSLKIKHNKVLGYFIEITTKNADKMLAEKDSQYIHRQTMANVVRFSTVALSELEDKIRGASEKSLALELKIFDDLTSDVLARVDDIAKTARALALVDVTSSLAELAVEKNYCRPVINDSLDFNIVGGRHPVVEEAIEADDAGAFTPNGCDLGGDVGECHGKLWLLTGPNMAGKSTFLRQNAIIAVLAQMGSFVPAESASIGVVDKLFSRVGASDNLAKGQSTFMVEMVETAAIVNQATERSLVILDEIGRGTATFDGLSIAWAVVEHLHEVNKSRALFATHYHELTSLATKMKNIFLHSMHVKEWDDNIIFMHEVIKGSADRSYGIHVAKLAGVPSNVLVRAEQVLEKLETGEQKSAITTELANDLPLFAIAGISDKNKDDTKMQKSAISKIEKAVKDSNPDDMTPKDALDFLYSLRKFV